MYIVWFQEISVLRHGKLLEIQSREGFLKPNLLKECMKLIETGISRGVCVCVCVCVCCGGGDECWVHLHRSTTSLKALKAVKSL